MKPSSKEQLIQNQSAGLLTTRQIRSLGIDSIAQLLCWLPKKYIDLTNIVTSINSPDFQIGERRVIELSLVSKHFPQSIPPRVQLTFDDDYNTEIAGAVFGDTHAWKSIPIGQKIWIAATKSEFNSNPQLKDISLLESDQAGKVIPVYPSIRGVLSRDTISQTIAHALDQFSDEACEYIFNCTGLNNDTIFDRTGIKDLNSWLLTVHRPKKLEHGLLALKYAKQLAIEEFAFRVNTNFQASASRRPPIALNFAHITELIKNARYQLTGDQLNTVDEIASDILSENPSFRLINGDVGTGKTIAYLIPFLAAHYAGAKVAIITPTVPLVNQIAATALMLDPNLNLQKIVAGTKIKDDSSVMIGTTALLHAGKRISYDPDILLIDEQQRFSSKQRYQLRAPTTHYFEATATPVPRSQALVTHPTMKLSILKQSPVEKVIYSSLIQYDQRSKVYDQLTSIVDAGDKVLIVYPIVAIKDSENQKKNVIEAYARWDRLFPGLVRMMHSQQSDEEKAKAIADLKIGHAQILVASTSVEVGIDIPSVRGLLVVDPENYGYSQLHQLRGRLARNGGEGHFMMLLTREVPEETLERLKVLENVSDGFTLAEKDLQIRGFGDVAFDSESSSGSTATLFRTVKIDFDDLQVYAQKVSLAQAGM